MHYGGSSFQRITVERMGISQPTVSCVIKRVTLALCNHKAEFMRMTDEEERRVTSQRMEQQFHLLAS
jgi:hypothetical protein